MRRVATLFLLATGLVTSTSTTRAQDLLECLVPGIQDFRAGPAHLDQADIVSGRMPFSEVLATGLTLLITNFNRCDGQGRPGATGRDIPENGRCRPRSFNSSRGHPASKRCPAPAATTNRSP